MPKVVNNEPIEIKLMKMPFPQMLDALGAFDELDDYLLTKLDEIQDRNEVEHQLAQITKRRIDREKFICFRMAMDLGIAPTLHS